MTPASDAPHRGRSLHGTPLPGDTGIRRLGDVVDELHDDDRLAHAATEGTDLSSLDEGADEIDDLDARLENVGLGILFEECRGLLMGGFPRFRKARG